MDAPTPLPASWSMWSDILNGPSDEAAPLLLGAVLRTADGVSLRIVEVEAYTGPGSDEASHAHRGRTPRNAAMFDDPPRLYVYLSYGIHHCVNVVAHPPGLAGGVLLRAAQVIDGMPTARTRRPTGPDDRMASGPGRLGQVAGVTLSDTGSPLFGRGALTLISPPGAVAVDAIRRGPRIGVSRAADRPWRWWIAGDPSVSGSRISRRAGRPGSAAG